jgi:hypothetical protein
LKHEASADIPRQNTILVFIFGILVSFDHWFGIILFAYSVRRLRASPIFLIAGVPTELGEIPEQESQQKLKNIVEATILLLCRVKRAKAPPGGGRHAGLGFSD